MSNTLPQDRENPYIHSGHVGKPRKATPTTGWKVRIPEDLAAKVDLIMMDPLTQKVTYGARSDYIVALIRADLRARGLTD